MDGQAVEERGMSNSGGVKVRSSLVAVAKARDRSRSRDVGYVCEKQS